MELFSTPALSAELLDLQEFGMEQIPQKKKV